jgi:uncharacterized protein (TIGR03086 family)
MDPRRQLDAILPLLDDLVAGLTPDDLHAATPCARFDVSDVLAHMVGGATVFAAAFRGDPTPPSDGAAPPHDLVAAFPEAMLRLAAAVRSPGAMERTIASPFGEMPGETFARLVALDGLVHGWDLAIASGQPYDPPADVVAAVEAFARDAITDDLRDGDTFAVASDPGPEATRLERVVAFTGRTVPA